MGTTYSFLATEKKTWVEHKIVYDLNIRKINLPLVDKACRENDIIFLGYYNNSRGGTDYQHWFVTDEKQIYYLEFGAPFSNVYGAQVSINTSVHKNSIIFKELTCKVDNEVLQRITLVLGMSNYSLCLRNCEHVANNVVRN